MLLCQIVFQFCFLGLIATPHRYSYENVSFTLDIKYVFVWQTFITTQQVHFIGFSIDISYGITTSHSYAFCCSSRIKSFFIVVYVSFSNILIELQFWSRQQTLFVVLCNEILRFWLCIDVCVEGIKTIDYFRFSIDGLRWQITLKKIKREKKEKCQIIKYWIKLLRWWMGCESVIVVFVLVLVET